MSDWRHCDAPGCEVRTQDLARWVVASLPAPEREPEPPGSAEALFAGMFGGQPREQRPVLEFCSARCCGRYMGARALVEEAEV